MRINKNKALSIVLLLCLLMQAAVFHVYSAPPEMLPLFAPENLRTEAKETGKPVTGFISNNDCYVDIIWDESSVQAYPASAFYNIYIREVSKYGLPSAFTLRDSEKGLPASINSQPFRITNLKPGTMYQFQIRAYYKIADGTTTYTSAESPASNTISVLTDINLVVGPPAGTNQIRMEWDDVWTLNGRIDYRLYISENGNFANTEPIYISRNMIGTAGPVFVNQVTGRLEYYHPVRDPGKLYYVKLSPDINDSGLIRNEETKTQYTNTYIFVKTTRVADTSAGIIWRLDWTPVNTGLSTDLTKAYLIYKGRIGSTAAPDYMASVTGDTSFFVTVPAEDKTTYFRIVADIRDKNTGREVFPIRITSDDIIVKEVDVPNTPPVPELRSEIRDAGDQLLASYDNLLGSDTATILWKEPRRANGSIDTDIEYDIWLIGDSKYIDNPPDNMRIAESFKFDINNENLVVKDDSGNITGYRYKLNGLTPNGTYYFKVAAKKRFIDFVDGEMTDIVLSSQPAFWVIITRPQGPIDQPVVPGKPPLRIKEIDGKDAVTGDSVILQLKNKWYEKFDSVSGRWTYIDTGVFLDPAVSQSEKNELLSLIAAIDGGTADRSLYRKIEYDEGVGLDIGCIKESELTSYQDIARIPAEKIVDFPTNANDPDEVPEIPNDSKHNIDILIDSLEENTSYVIWVKAVRRKDGTAYEPSDPIVVITKPTIPDYPVYPTVPMFNYTSPSDRYVDLGWTEFKPEYTYYVAWSNTDNISKADNSVKVTAEDYAYYYYRVEELDPGTAYYFWVRAEASDASGNKVLSEWGDSLSVKTLPNLPPNPPRGFGISTASDAVGKNSITFEWVQEQGLEYELEVSETSDFKAPGAYQAGQAAKYTVGGLRSNYRYYARLYAYDPDKKLRSLPSPVITVRTERSTDDYDSDKNTEDILTGDFVEKDNISVGRAWNIKITGTNAVRFIEHIMKDSTLDYRLKADKPPAYTDRICLTVASSVFSALDSLKENLVIEAGDTQLVIRPFMFLTAQAESLGRKVGDFNYRITVALPKQAYDMQGLTFQTKITRVAIEAYDGGNLIPVHTLNKPLKLLVPYSGSWYREGETSGYVYIQTEQKWERCRETYLSDTGYGSFIAIESTRTGDVGLANRSEALYDDLAGQSPEVRQAVLGVSKIHKLKSIAGPSFRPSSNALLGDSVKLMLDVLDYDYGSQYMLSAAKAGIIEAADIAKGPVSCTRERAAYMAVRVYEIKTLSSIPAVNSSATGFSDLGSVTPSMRQRVYFAVNNGILTGKTGNRLEPGGFISRGELMIMLEKVLILSGELE